VDRDYRIGRRKLPAGPRRVHGLVRKAIRTRPAAIAGSSLRHTRPNSRCAGANAQRCMPQKGNCGKGETGTTDDLSTRPRTNLAGKYVLKEANLLFSHGFAVPQRKKVYEKHVSQTPLKTCAGCLTKQLRHRQCIFQISGMTQHLPGGGDFYRFSQRQARWFQKKKRISQSKNQGNEQHVQKNLPSSWQWAITNSQIPVNQRSQHAWWRPKCYLMLLKSASWKTHTGMAAKLTPLTGIMGSMTVSLITTAPT